MEVTFYKTSSDPKCLHKTLSTALGTALVLEPTASVGCLNPVLSIKYNSTFLPANYCQIDTFGRYYWCSVAVDTAGRMTVSCKVDYLMSWATEIEACPATIVRAELGKPTYVPDNKLPVDSKRYFTEGIKFPQTSLSGGGGMIYPNYVMITR